MAGCRSWDVYTGKVADYRCVMPGGGWGGRPAVLPMLLQPAVTLPMSFWDKAAPSLPDDAEACLAVGIRSQRRVCFATIPRAPQRVPLEARTRSLYGSRIVDLPGSPLPSPASALGSSPGGHVLAAGCEDGTVLLWGVGAPADGGPSIHAMAGRTRDSGRAPRLLPVGDDGPGGAAASDGSRPVVAVAACEWGAYGAARAAARARPGEAAEGGEGADGHAIPATLVVAARRGGDGTALSVGPWRPSELHKPGRALLGALDRGVAPSGRPLPPPSCRLVLPAAVSALVAVPLPAPPAGLSPPGAARPAAPVPPACLVVSGTSSGQVTAWVARPEADGRPAMALCAELLCLEGAAASRGVPVTCADACFRPGAGAARDAVAVIAVGGADGRVRTLVLSADGAGAAAAAAPGGAGSDGGDAAACGVLCDAAASGCGVHLTHAGDACVSETGPVRSVCFHPTGKLGQVRPAGGDGGVGGARPGMTATDGAGRSVRGALLGSDTAGDSVLWAWDDWPALPGSASASQAEGAPGADAPGSGADHETWRAELRRVARQAASAGCARHAGHPGAQGAGPTDTFGSGSGPGGLTDGGERTVTRSVGRGEPAAGAEATGDPRMAEEAGGASTGAEPSASPGPSDARVLAPERPWRSSDDEPSPPAQQRPQGGGVDSTGPAGVPLPAQMPAPMPSPRLRAPSPQPLPRMAAPPEPAMPPPRRAARCRRPDELPASSSAARDRLLALPVRAEQARAEAVRSREARERRAAALKAGVTRSQARGRAGSRALPAPRNTGVAQLPCGFLDPGRAAALAAHAEETRLREADPAWPGPRAGPMGEPQCGSLAAAAGLGPPPPPSPAADADQCMAEAEALIRQASGRALAWRPVGL